MNLKSANVLGKIHERKNFEHFIPITLKGYVLDIVNRHRKNL